MKRIFQFEKTKFRSLKKGQQHKKCAELLHHYISSKKAALIEQYVLLCLWLEIEPLPNYSFEQIEERFHWHMRKTDKGLQESNFLAHLMTKDGEPTKNWLTIHTYLDGLRSSHNVGSIIRTIEAFRLGPLSFSPTMMEIDSPQIRKTSMGAWEYVQMQKQELSLLPRPWIGLETISTAPLWNEWIYPKQGTLVVGNEERGIGSQILQNCDTILQIPMVGCKNSLNVANAFSIIAAQIAYQHGQRNS